MRTHNPHRWRSMVAASVALSSLAPLTASSALAAPQLFHRAPARTAPAQGMSTRKKAVLLAGAALLYYLYKRHQANQATAPSAPGAPANTRSPQLYRSRNGGVYYRDAAGKPIWLTVPAQGMSVPADDVQRYAPDYNRYRGPAPSAPRNYTSQPFSTFDHSLMSGAPRRM